MDKKKYFIENFLLNFDRKAKVYDKANPKISTKIYCFFVHIINIDIIDSVHRCTKILICNDPSNTWTVLSERKEGKRSLDVM